MNPIIRFLPALLASLSVAVAARPLNIVAPYADDWGYDTLGVAGSAKVVDASARLE